MGVDIQQEARDIAEALGCRDMETPELTRHFMDRLARLLNLSDTYAGQLDPTMARILRRAIFSTYLDLRDLGRGEEALRFIRYSGRTLAGAGKSLASPALRDSPGVRQ